MNKQTTTTTKKDHNIEIILKEKKTIHISTKTKKNFNKENFNSILVTKKKQCNDVKISKRRF